MLKLLQIYCIKHKNLHVDEKDLVDFTHQINAYLILFLFLVIGNTSNFKFYLIYL